MNNMNSEAESGAAVGCSALLGVDEQLKILEMARHQLRDKETDYRKSSDEWHKLGAVETARARCDKANALDEAVTVLLEVERKYRNAKNATYA